MELEQEIRVLSGECEEARLSPKRLELASRRFLAFMDKMRELEVFAGTSAASSLAMKSSKL
jgi:hypothetical protein